MREDLTGAAILGDDFATALEEEKLLDEENDLELEKLLPPPYEAAITFCEVNNIIKKTAVIFIKPPIN